MARQGRSLLLLLMITLAFSRQGEVEQHLVMRVGSDEGIPLCSDDSLVLVWCSIRPEAQLIEECRLVYRDDQNLDSSCTSRFTLETHNQTVSLHLSDLTSEDSGNYSCQCSFAAGVQHLHLNLTVIGDVYDNTGSLTQLRNSFWILLISVTAVVSVTWTCLGFICWKKRSRRQNPKSAANTIYSFLHKPADDLYQNIPKSISVALAAKTVDQDANVTPSSLLYENIPTKMKTELGFSFADS